MNTSALLMTLARLNQPHPSILLEPQVSFRAVEELESGKLMNYSENVRVLLAKSVLDF